MVAPLLLEFQRTVDYDKDLIYGKAASRQACFVRDEIGRHLLKTPIFVVSTHTSKSCLLPVYSFTISKKVEVHMRENFYGWVISLKSIDDKPFHLPEGFVHGDNNEDGTNDIHACYCEGFKDEWVYPFNTGEVTETTFRIGSDYNLYTFFYLLNKELEAEYKASEEVLHFLDASAIKYFTEFHKGAHPKCPVPFELFPKSFHMVTDWKYEKENNLEYLSTEDIEGFAERVANYPENKAKIAFERELAELTLGSMLDVNEERMNWALVEVTEEE